MTIATDRAFPEMAPIASPRRRSRCDARPAVAVSLAFVWATAVACGGPGPYGHAPQYVPTGDERRAVAAARPYDGALVERQPQSWRGAVVTLFGVVQERAVGPAGQALLKLGVRSLAPRSACARPGDDESCRVAIQGNDYGVVWALVALRADDDTGPHAVGQGSLLRIVGTLAQDVSPEGGAPVVHVSFYRHWPPREYAAPR